MIALTHKPKVFKCQYFLFGLSCVSQLSLCSFAMYTHILRLCLQVTTKSNLILFGPEISSQTAGIVLLPVATVSYQANCKMYPCFLSVKCVLRNVLFASRFPDFLPLAKPFSLSEPLFLHLQNGADNNCLASLIQRQSEVIWKLYDICSTAPTNVKIPGFEMSIWGLPAHQGFMLPLHCGSFCTEW